MSRARLLRLVSRRRAVALGGLRREASRLDAEIERLTDRRKQIAQLDAGYRDGLTQELRGRECRDLLQIMARLSESDDADRARLSILVEEQTRVRRMLVAEQMKIDDVDERARVEERRTRAEAEDKAAALLPTSRRSGT